MQWILPPMARKTKPDLPSWWVWLILPLLCVALSAVVLVFTWPVARGFADLRFWFWLLVAPLLSSGALSLFWLSEVLQRRREVDSRHLFLDRKQAQWVAQGRTSLKLAAWHLVTPEPELMLRVVGLSGTVPEAPAATQRLPVDKENPLGQAGNCPVWSQLLSPLQHVLRSLSVVDIWCSVSGQDQNEARQSLLQSWQTLSGRPLPTNRLHWLSAPADASLLEQWCDTPFDTPRLIVCLHQITDDAKATEFSTALLFLPHNQHLPEQLPFRPVYVFRPLLMPQAAPEKKLTALLDVQQVPPGHRRHLWDAGHDARARNMLLSTLDEYGDPLPADGQHALSSFTGETGPEGFWLALTLAVEATDIGQQGQVVLSPLEAHTACLQISIRPADRVNMPVDSLPRYPLAWFGGSCCLILLFALLPPPSVLQVLWPWLVGGFALYALLLAFAIPLVLRLWHFRLEDEWSAQENQPYE